MDAEKVANLREKKMRAVRPVRSLFLSLSIALLSACAIQSTHEVGRPFDRNLVDSIQNGKTTRARIVQMFGRPTHKSNEKWSYVHAPAKKVNAFAPTGTQFTETRPYDILEIIFDDTGVVETYEYKVVRQEIR